MRTHHMDAHLLNDGTWVAAIDGDSMYSVRGLSCKRKLASAIMLLAGALHAHGSYWACQIRQITDLLACALAQHALPFNLVLKFGVLKRTACYSIAAQQLVA